MGKLYYLQILNKSKYGKLSDLNRTKVKFFIPREELFSISLVIQCSNRLDYQLTIFKEKKELINRYISKLKDIIFFSQRDYQELKKIYQEKIFRFIF